MKNQDLLIKVKEINPIYITLLIFYLVSISSNSLFSQNRCLRFDGKDDRVEADSPLDDDSDYTVEAWFKSENNQKCVAGKYLRIIGWRNSSLEIAVCGDDLRFYDGRVWVSTKKSVGGGEWHHVAVVREKPNYSIYLDGELVRTYSRNNTIDLSGFFSVGSKRHSNSSSSIKEYWKGMIDEVRIWNKPRSTEEINSSINNGLLGNEAGLVLYFNFEQGQPERNNSDINEILDLSLNGNYGKLTRFSMQGATSNIIILLLMLLKIHIRNNYR